MKNLVKLVNVNDRHDKDHQNHLNGYNLYISSMPRVERIIAAFLDDGWKLINLAQRCQPSILQPGGYSFYPGGWNLLFTKTVEDDSADNSDEIISKVLHDLDCPETEDDEYAFREDGADVSLDFFTYEDRAGMCRRFLRDEFENCYYDEDEDRIIYADDSN